ncbi:zinc ribbon domain-containing protein [Nonomuraea sp. NPDC050310]|uniref:Zn-ribbon domain-containing OB-fold protein n=1 Tax=Nonomuraea sp. NPDC050310 TaxID=3154935 RepID=UPI003402FF94
MDRDSREWWERLGRHELLVQRCLTCGRTRFPARAFCAGCRGERWEWTSAGSEGVVESWIVERRREPGVTVVRVRLAGCVFHGRWTGESAPEAGGPARPVFTGSAEGTRLDWGP